MKYPLLKTLICASLLATHAEAVCSNNQPTDFLFLIDASSGMCPYSQALASGINNFVNQLQGKSSDYRISVATFGGQPRLLQSFSSDLNLLKRSTDRVGCAQNGQEAGLEAIRMALNNTSLDMTKDCEDANACRLNWRENAKKFIILATDEDSDRPTNKNYYAQGQAGKGLCPTGYQGASSNKCLFKQCGDSNCNFEPSFKTLTPTVVSKISQGGNTYTIYQKYRKAANNFALDAAYQAEIDATAKALQDSGAMISLLVRRSKNSNTFQPSSSFNNDNYFFKKIIRGVAKPSDYLSNIHTALLQYGDPKLNVFSSNNALDKAATLSQYSAKTVIANSLQGQILSGNGYASVYDLEKLVDANGQPAPFVDTFYQSLADAATTCPQ